MLSIIVPVYNEEENVEHMVAALLEVAGQYGPSVECIFVDDGSKDNSYAKLAESAKANSIIKVIRFARNMGQTAAIQAGIDHATGETLVFLDADLQNDPADIPKLLHKLDEGYDVVSGWRKDRQDNAIKRNFPSRIANWLISIISGVHLHDYGCTLKAYRKDVIKGVRLYGEMHRFIPIYAAWMGAKVTEVLVTHHARKFGQSKYGIERIFKVLLDLLVVKFFDKHLYKPMYVFGGCGIFSFLLATIAFIWALCLKLFNNISLIQTPLLLVSSVFALVGVMCILMGLLAEIMSRTYHESQGKNAYIVREHINIPEHDKEKL